MDLTIEELLETEVTSAATIRYLCALRKCLVTASELSDEDLKLSIYVERLYSSFSFEERRIAFEEGKRYANRLTDKAATPAPSRPVPQFIEPPKKQEAVQMTRAMAVDHAKAFIRKLRHERTTEFVTGLIYSYVRESHLDKETLRWCGKDAQISSSNQPNWKLTTSLALQDLKNEGLISYRQHKNTWFVFPD